MKGNNVLIDHNNFGKLCGFVEQNNILFEYLTPKELLYYSSKLKLNLSEELLEKKVGNLIQQVKYKFTQFGLEKCSNTAISYLSGGERKKILIGNILSN